MSLLSASSTPEYLVDVTAGETGSEIGTYAPVKISVDDNVVEVVEVYARGLPSADVNFATESLEVVDPDETTHILTNQPRPDSLKVYLNGLREENYEVTGSTVDFADINLTIGDTLTFDYAHGV